MSSIIKAIQMIGTQRSGSNLLRLMLSQLPGVFAPHPPHILLNFYPLLDRYGDLTVDNNFTQLIDDVCRVIELNPVPWEGAVLDRQRIWDMCRRRSLLEIFIRIHELQCISHGLDTWCCKSLETVAYVDHYAAEGIWPFVIYLYRDGRDVALSFRKAIVGEKHVYHLAQKWRQDQQQALDFLATISADRYVALRYEELTAEPTAHIHHICDKFSLPYSDGVLEYYKSSESQRTAVSGHMWENLTKPIMKDNTGKFLKEMTRKDLVIYESVAGDMLERLGFQLITPPEERQTFTKEQIMVFDAENAALKEESIRTADPHDLELRRPQAEFWKALRARPVR